MSGKKRLSMRRAILLTLLTTLSLYGFAESVTTFSSDFEQSIVDADGKEIVYRGSVTAKRPDRAYWHYDAPVAKEVYIVGEEVVIVEPDMEQAIIRWMGEEIDFFSILSHAEKTGPEQFEARYNDQSFTLKVTDGLLRSISYRDTFENRVEIRFSHPVYDAAVPETTFEAKIPATYDIIR